MVFNPVNPGWKSAIRSLFAPPVMMVRTHVCWKQRLCFGNVRWRLGAGIKPQGSEGFMTATTFTPLASAAGGVLIGVSAVILFVCFSRIAGITGTIRRLLPPYGAGRPLEALAFLAGLIAAPIFWSLITGTQVTQTVSGNLPLLAAAGLLVGFGSAWGNGCTSGHGVCGLSRFSPRSLAATLTFMSVAVAAVYVVRHVLGS